MAHGRPQPASFLTLPLRATRHASRHGAVVIPLSRSRREAIRTNLWAVPTGMVVLVLGLFAVTYSIDRRVAAGDMPLAGWLTSGGPDVARMVLIGIATSVITVAGVVFSITILVLQLASQQFGPRMLRNFIRDTGTQVSLGAFVATFVYSVLTLQVVSDPPQQFVPHVSTSVAVALVLVDLGVLIYFIDHVAISIQLTSVVSGIAADFRTTVAQLQANEWQLPQTKPSLDGSDALRPRVSTGEPIAAQSSGFLQAVGYERLVSIATECDAVIHLLHRPGHFVVAGQPLARVFPPSAVGPVSRALVRAHIVGPNRTLTQDPAFAIDQLVEVALRALSPAVNDTFTALNCIDWLGDCLCHAFVQQLPSGIYCDRNGEVRVIEPIISLQSLVKRATDKIRQAGHGMPAVLIRQLENLQKVMSLVATPEQRETLLHHARLIVAAGEQSVPEEADRADIHAAYDALLAVTGEMWEG